MIRSSDIDRLFNFRAIKRGSIEEWCKQNDVDESVIHRLVAVYGHDKTSAVAAIDAFRLGHEARRGDEPRGQLLTDENGSRYGVQFVVVDTRTGRIVGDASASRADVDGFASTYNDLSSQSTGRAQQ